MFYVVFHIPSLVILHYAKFEVFEVPDIRVLQHLAIVWCLNVCTSTLYLSTIAMTSALFASFGAILQIPVSIAADKIMNDYVLPPLVYVGIGVILVGFILFYGAEVMLSFKNDTAMKNRDGDDGNGIKSEAVVKGELNKFANDDEADESIIDAHERSPLLLNEWCCYH